MQLITHEEFIRKVPHRARDLVEMERHVGSVRKEIKDLIRSRPKVRVLEVGCGYGSVLMQLNQIFGPSIELHGINKYEHHGDHSILRHNALYHGFANSTELETSRLPKIHFADVDKGLPFADRSFDLVISQVAFHLFREKSFFIEEVNRILDIGGIAKIDVYPIERKKVPKPYSCLFEIWDENKEVLFWEYLNQFSSLTRISMSGDLEYLRIEKADQLRLGLKLVHCVNISEIDPWWVGVKSIYTRQAPA